MAQIITSSTRPDSDITDDIESLIIHYPPSNQDRHRFSVVVFGGVVTMRGNVRTPNTRRYLADRIATIAGVNAVDASQLHDEETIRFAAGRVVPPGVIANVDYGSVILSGVLPPGTSTDDLATQIGAIPGVRRVVSGLK